ncbi:DMT family transporter [Photobacterium lutimaris]|uniref:EamA/RhaT family transporter n=1 Tax=Photobacterium lutimaris TaxID=388278 RepID=A0A2T3J148_9GAMM|nr:DMT family transporter [Photobacterium lutimaris]PSU34796.1 EamA/RhaT family transporter [Photobacterium lutimaris]TDR77122.1 EamA-like transporter family protein [Photobacterium lutimaris]
MLAFAGNSLLCRLALVEGSIDAGSFTLIRLISGAITLVVLTLAMHSKASYLPVNWKKSDIVGAMMLFGYATTFSFSYVNIATGTGALILFASVQFSMIGFHLFSGNRMQLWEWGGVGVSLIGFGYLLLPTATRPDVLAALLMIIAGMCWAAFTILGKQSTERPSILTMSINFLLASLLAVLVVVLVPLSMEIEHITYRGALLAVLSGAVASGIGYAIWYAVLPTLSILRASVVQLSVPALASIGGWTVLREAITISTGIATLLILGGIALVFAVRN